MTRLSLAVLTQAEIETVHELTMKLLASEGLTFNSAPALDLFKKSGFKTDEAKVFVDSRQLENALASAPAETTIHSRNPERKATVGANHPPVFLSASGAPMIITEDGAQRPVVFDDYLDMLRLTQTSPVLGMANSGALYPTYHDPELALRLQVNHALTMTDLPLVGQTEGEALSRFCVDMAQAASGLTDAPVLVGICNSLSPMAWDARMLEGIKVFAERGQVLNISCCAMCGATAPVFLLGAVVEANCEVLGGLIYSQLVRPGTPVIYGTTSSVMDMSSMGLALGAPEYGLISGACGQMAKRYGLPYRSGGGLTDAKVLDAQAGLESAWNILTSLMGGVNFMLQSVGILESFMAVAFDKWVFDEEIIGRAKRLLAGIGPFPSDLPQIFHEGLENGGYLKLKSTLKNFRKEFHRPTLGDRRNFEAYRQRGRTVRDDAWSLVKNRLAEYVKPKMEASCRKAMDDVFAKTVGEAPPELN
ncbi:MAG: trimethylamine methyltransferase family protein [Deltaproteobacteria bacterium]|jgi:trimethylamine--corrinoid protein Co-methyltransferase|nr:trimethylamine methyltransferase family protein [Deltaproteobacteria bacterium]